MTKVFLTGANGHIGSNTARELLKRGYEVVGYVRETSDLRGLEGLDIELRKGDIQDPERINQALEGCDLIIHTAAVYSLWAPTDAEIINPCIRGTNNILNAAKLHGIQRVVFTSSSAAIGGSKDPTTIRDEGDWNEKTESPYYIAKTDSEHLAHRLAAELGVELIILNPTIVLGPYDYRITPSTSMLQSALNGAGTVWDSIVGFVHVDDVARLHVDGMTMGTPGERYIVNGTSIHLKEVGQIWKEMFGVRTMYLNLPQVVTSTMGRVLGLISGVTGSPPLYDHRIHADFMSMQGNYANRKSIETFGIEYKDLRTIFADTAAWLIHGGFVKPKAADRLRPDYPASPE